MVFSLRAYIGFLVVLCVSGETCTNPSATTLTYTSRNVALSAETAYVAEVYLKCKEEHSIMDLFAEIEPGVITPVASIPEKESYQISWAKDHKVATTGTIKIKVFDNDGYNAYRKAQRNGEDVSVVPALFNVVVHHPGVSREGLFVQTEFVAVIAALLIWWGANTVRSQIME